MTKRVIRTSWPVQLSNGTRLTRGDHVLERGATLKLALAAKGVGDVTDIVLAEARKQRAEAVALLEQITGETAMPRDDKLLAEAIQGKNLAEERNRQFERSIMQTDAELREKSGALTATSRELSLIRAGAEKESRDLQIRITELEAAFAGVEAERQEERKRVVELEAEVSEAATVAAAMRGEVTRLEDEVARLSAEVARASVAVPAVGGEAAAG